MFDVLGRNKNPKKLDDIDLPRIGSRIGVGEDEIHAVIDVESLNGSGFDRKGRLLMLFEPHIFYKQLSGSERTKAVMQNLASPKWGQIPYPRDSYPRLEKAININREAALRSCSWGMFQIMGFNHSVCGYNTIDDMLLSFAKDEENHLEAMVTFVITNGLDDELRRHDWAGFARGYNGPGYRKNNYHIRLEQRFNFWKAIRDTPYVEKPFKFPFAPIFGLSKKLGFSK